LVTEPELLAIGLAVADTPPTLSANAMVGLTTVSSEAPIA